MTYSSDRLDRIESLLATTIEGLESTKKIVESNARAIEAWDSRIADGDQRVQSQLEEAIADTVQMIAELGQRQQETDQHIEIFLQDSRADRQRSEQLSSELSQRFEVFLAESRADRQRADQDRALAEQRHQAWLADSASAQARFERTMEANAAEHKAMLAAIARLGRN